jgi:uncharacterized damage-inducible protein DinB
MSSKPTIPAVVITPEALLEHWQGHRRLTRRIIEAFPEDELFTFSIGGMRTFGELALELIRMAAPIARGVATGEWVERSPEKPSTKEGLLRLWDEGTEELNELWPQIRPERFQEVDTAFGYYEGPTWSHIFYAIDNENHHRGQGYVYLRALGIEPPHFWER